MTRWSVDDAAGGATGVSLDDGELLLSSTVSSTVAEDESLARFAPGALLEHPGPLQFDPAKETYERLTLIWPYRRSPGFL